MAEALKAAGYNTYGVGKWHVGHQESPETRGFDEYYGYTRGYSANQWDLNSYRRLPADRKPEIEYKPENFYATDAFSDYAVEFVKQAQGKKEPFFLYLAHSSPHFPLQAPAKTRDTYLEIYRRGWDVLRKERYERQKKSGLVTKSWQFTELSDVPTDREDIANGFPGKQNPAWKEVAADRREDLVYRMATFAAMVDHVDQGIGRILRQLEKGGNLDDTLILFTSDNGACYEWGPFGFDGHSRTGKTTLHKGDDLNKVGGPGTHHSVGSAWSCLSNTPMRMYKHFNFEGGQCSPMIAHWPKGIKNPDRWVRTPIHLIDLMPTICSVAGAEYPETFAGNKIQPVEGTSLQSIFEGGIRLARTCSLLRPLRVQRNTSGRLETGSQQLPLQQWGVGTVQHRPGPLRNQRPHEILSRQGQEAPEGMDGLGCPGEGRSLFQTCFFQREGSQEKVDLNSLTHPEFNR